jgi:hypothetical protein
MTGCVKHGRDDNTGEKRCLPMRRLLINVNRPRLGRSQYPVPARTACLFLRD